ncbi:MAG: hypothetical protein JWO31_4089, partial [Phycisphaerales bacterium]|nr:hypothetical protein [Phycisphaerales bacterium]
MAATDTRLPKPDDTLRLSQGAPRARGTNGLKTQLPRPETQRPGTGLSEAARAELTPRIDGTAAHDAVAPA